MKGRPIVVEFQGEPRSLSEVGRLIGVAPRTMSWRWHTGKRGAHLVAPADERKRRRGSWQHCTFVSMPAMIASVLE